MVKRCDMCFQQKETLMPILSKMPAVVCKACSYKIGQVLAFIQYHNGTFSYQPDLSKENPPDPPSPGADIKEDSQDFDKRLEKARRRQQNAK